MSKFSDRLNDARGKESIRSASARAAKLGDVGESTLHPYFRAEHPRPTDQVVVALAKALKVPADELYGLAGIPVQGDPWTPPDESRYMSDRQRRAVTELIRSFVLTLGADHAVEIAQESDAQAQGRQPQKTTPASPDKPRLEGLGTGTYPRTQDSAVSDDEDGDKHKPLSG